MSFKDYLKKHLSAEREQKENLTDKIFVRSAITSFIAIIVCIVMLSASTYAWFTESVHSTETIQTSVYKLELSTSPSLTPTVISGNSRYTLAANTEYTVSAHSIADDTTNGSTGYIKMVVNGVTYLSEQIDRGQTLSFTLSFTAETEIEIIECWGTSSKPDASRQLKQGSSFTDMTPDG